jgi:integrase
LPPDLEETVRSAREYASAARAPNTLKAYTSDVEDFATFCRVDLGGVSALPADPETVALYATDLAGERGLKVATIERRLASISARHKRSGLPSPTATPVVREVMKGIRRKKGSAQDRAAPLTVEVLKKVLDSTAMRPYDPETGRVRPAVLRDRALLLLGFAGALRRSELSALRASDLDFSEDGGVLVTVRSSKTDAAGEGAVVPVPYGSGEETCPVRSLERWLDYSGRAGEEPVFCPIDRHGNLKKGRPLSGDGINDVVKKRVEGAGLDPDRYSGHSLRAGLPTSASRARVGMEGWMPHTRHKSVKVAKGYVRLGTLWEDNPVTAVGL